MEYFECLPKSVLSKITLVSDSGRRQLGDLESDRQVRIQDVPSWFPVVLMIINKHLRHHDPNYWIVFELDSDNSIKPIFQVKTTPLGLVSLMHGGALEKIIPSTDNHVCHMKPISKYELDGKTFNLSISKYN